MVDMYNFESRSKKTNKKKQQCLYVVKSKKKKKKNLSVRTLRPYTQAQM